MGKKYSVNRGRNGKVIYEVDGALYSDISHVPDEADRAVLAGMDDGSSGQGYGTDLEASAGIPVAEYTARTRAIILLVFGTIAVIMLLAAAVSSYDAIGRATREVQAPGLVVDTVVESDYDPDTGVTYYSYPVTSFTDRDGRNHTVTVPQGSSPPEWEKGDAVTVLYDPGNPADARIESWSSDLFLWLPAIVTGILGAGFFLAVLVVLKVMPPPGTR